MKKKVGLKQKKIKFNKFGFCEFTDDEYVNMDIMNLYKLIDGKVKKWRLWFSQDADLIENG